MRHPQSILIAFEGIDGAGKTTQTQMLKRALDAAGLEVVVSREPTKGPHGQRIRQSAMIGRLSLSEELEAFTADRREHVSEVISPALEAGKIVILDRYFYSTLAYQGARGADLVVIRETQSFAPIPDMVFFIDTVADIGLYRIEATRGDTPNHFETLENLKTVYKAFKALNDANITTIDGNPSAQAVHRAVLDSFIEGPLKAKMCFKSYGCDDPFNCGPRLTGTCEWWKIVKALADSKAFATL